MLLLTASALAQPVPVTVEQAEGGAQLYRGGVPLSLRGVGGEQDLALLAKIGGTAIRTWGTDGSTAALLDEAHQHGLTVSVGIWLGHTRHGFDYTDPEQVAAQKEQARQAVLAHRDHPAVLMWGVGNEMEGFEQGDDPAIWAAVCDIAEMIQALDPHHPVMTTTADIGGGRVASVSGCDAIDIHGVNSYGGGPSLPERYAAAGGQKPIVLTEYGHAGTWEVPYTDFGAPPELTSTDKAAAYTHIATEVVSQPGVLGAFAFLWGWKTEATATWFGMLLPDGTRLAPVDALADAWGQPVANRVPVASALRVSPGDQLALGGELSVGWDISDPEGDPLAVSWSVRPEVATYLSGGDPMALPPALPGAVLHETTGEARIRMPSVPGVYRIYAVARDGHGGGATANIPVRVGEPAAAGAPLPVPWWLYQDAGVGGPWVPSGWMGATETIEVQQDWTDSCASPPSCVRFTVDDASWSGVAWQHPANNWGAEDGGLDLSQARWVRFKVRADTPNLSVTFGVGLNGADTAHPDSLKVEETVALSAEWQTVKIRLRGDRSDIATGLWWVVPPRASSRATFYIDDVVFE